MGAEAVKLTVLGSHASYAGPGNACSGYLYETETTHLLVDCGNGVLGHLARIMDPLMVDAIVVTHGHPDHFGDLYVFESLLRYAPEGPAGSIPLYAQPGLFEQVSASLCGFGRSQLDKAFSLHNLGAGSPFRVGDIDVMPFAVEHSVPTVGLRISAGGRTIVYSADTSPFPGLVHELRGADLALVDATMPEPFAGRAPHLTARQAGEAAQAAGIPELALVHLWPTNDESASLAEGSSAFGGPVSVAHAFDRYTLNGSGVRRDRAV